MLYYAPNFAVPTEPAELIAAMAAALREYENAKSAEVEAQKTTARVKQEEADVWNRAYQRAAGSSQAAKKEAAELDEEWKAYVGRKNDAADRQKDAERAHSVTYQRLETLRAVAALLKPRADEEAIVTLATERVLAELRVQEVTKANALRAHVSDLG